MNKASVRRGKIFRPRVILTKMGARSIRFGLQAMRKWPARPKPMNPKEPNVPISSYLTCRCEVKKNVSCTKKKPGLEPGLLVLLTAGDVIISTLIDPRSIIVVAGVGVISIIRGGIAVTWAIA
jgi:hypothetical protein